MDKVYGFPITPEERILLMSNALIGGGIIVALLVTMARLVEGMDVGLGELFAESTRLRVMFASLCGVYVSSLVWTLLYWRRAAGTTLRYNHERLSFVRLGWFGKFIENSEFGVGQLESLIVRRSAVFRVFELEVRGPGTRFVVPLARARADGDRQRRPRDLDDALQHPLVERLSSWSGVTAKVE